MQQIVAGITQPDMRRVMVKTDRAHAMPYAYQQTRDEKIMFKLRKDNQKYAIERCV
jgi:hypothetical protein